MKQLEGNIMIIVIVLSAFLLLRYLYIYISNKQFQRDKFSKLMLTISMNSIYTIFVVSLIFSLGIFNIIVISAESKEKQNQLNSIIETMQSGYDNMAFSNDILEEVYNEYNTFFAGHYTEDGDSYVICITEDSPQSLINLLNENLVDYKIVKYNYSDLYNLYKVILANPKFSEFKGVGINYKNNHIEIIVPIGYVLPNSFNNYLEIGVLSVEETDLNWVH